MATSSIVPPNGATVVFGLLQVAWFAWLGAVLLAAKPTARAEDPSTLVDDHDAQLTEAAR
jgi:hypothetical protein